MSEVKKFNKKEILAKIHPIIENVAMKNGLIPLETTFVKENDRWFLRIFIYSNDHEVTHKDCENITRGFDDYLDELIPVNYYLEVSSPGADRTLKSSIEYKIFEGKKVKLKLKELKEGLGTKKFEARIIDGMDKNAIKFQDLETGEEFILKEDEISSAKLCYEPKKVEN